MKLALSLHGWRKSRVSRRQYACREQGRPQSQMGVSFPAIQGGQDLRPPLRAPIWCLILRKYRQVSRPSSNPSSISSIHASASRQKNPSKFKASVRARANPRAAFPRARADEILFFARKNYRGRVAGKTENKAKQTKWKDQGGEEMRGEELVIWDQHCFSLCVHKKGILWWLWSWVLTLEPDNNNSLPPHCSCSGTVRGNYHWWNKGLVVHWKCYFWYSRKYNQMKKPFGFEGFNPYLLYMSDMINFAYFKKTFKISNPVKKVRRWGSNSFSDFYHTFKHIWGFYAKE